MSATLPCPVCKRPVSIEDPKPTFPFCSPRCRMIDLGAWAEGRYVVAGRPVGEDEQPVDLNDIPNA